MDLENQQIKLYPCCKIVEGASKDAIYDLQREEYFLIPHSMTMVLQESQVSSWKTLVNKYSKERETLEEYRQFLLNHDLCYDMDSNDIIIRDIESTYETPEMISNAIVDIGKDSTFDINQIVKQLNILGCENLEIRLFRESRQQELMSILAAVRDSCIRDLELLVKYSPDYLIENIIKLHLTQPRLRKITIYDSPDCEVGIYNHEEITVIFVSEDILDDSCCGVINQWYLLPKTELFIESLHYNSCLYKKVAVDQWGNIKNCPSMKRSFGNIADTALADVVCTLDFQRIWNITKDNIEVCKDCELRYMCQDCRAFICDANNLLSKPLKCTYNPYL